jgi:hypothetical protein
MSSIRAIGYSDADAAELSDVVHKLVAAQATLAAVQAEQMRLLARAQQVARRQTAEAVSRDRTRDMALRGISAEIAAALRTSDRSVQRQISEATTLVEHFPATLDAWATGRITRPHVDMITDLALPLPADVRATFEGLALSRCEKETTGRLRSDLAILAERLHPRTLTERHVAAREKRCVRTFAAEDGMSSLVLMGPTVHIEAIYDRTTQQAHAYMDLRQQARDAMKTASANGGVSTETDVILASDDRTLDQLRVDIMTDMLLTAQPSADPTRTDDRPGVLGKIRAKVQVVVSATTLLGADEHPADLVGRSPVDADTARRLAGTATDHWDRILTDPVTGTVLAVDSRFVTPAMRRFCNGRDWRCRFWGCSVPAIRTEIDHTVDHALGGPTSIDNSEGLCQRHHTTKQFTPWKVRQRGGGVLEWTSPLGHIYIDEPPIPSVFFTPDLDDPPPF